MGPAINLYSFLQGTDIFRHLLSIVNGHHDRLADLESLIGNRLDDQFDYDDSTSKNGDTKDDLSKDESI